MILPFPFSICLSRVDFWSPSELYVRRGQVESNVICLEGLVSLGGTYIAVSNHIPRSPC